MKTIQIVIGSAFILLVLPFVLIFGFFREMTWLIFEIITGQAYRSELNSERME